MKTKHCPFCNSTHLLYTVDIFKKPTDKDYYTGEVRCEECNKKFSEKEIKIRFWKEIKSLKKGEEK